MIIKVRSLTALLVNVIPSPRLHTIGEGGANLDNYVLNIIFEKSSEYNFFADM